MAIFKRSKDQPRKSNTKQVKRPRKHFLQVDVWQSSFGPVSVRAVYDIFQQKKGIDTKNLNKYSFSECVNYLRGEEDPNYIPPMDSARK